MERPKPVAHGALLMNGTVADWPPRDMAGAPIALGCEVRCFRDTSNVERPRPYTVGGLRLQNARGELRWAVCAYDDAPLYVEAYAEDCIVTKAAPPC